MESQSNVVTRQFKRRSYSELITNNGVENSEVATKKFKRRSVLMIHNGVDNTAKIPDCLLISILLLLPSESLRYSVKYVCKRWFNIINNEILSEVASVIIQMPKLINHHYGTRLVDICEENNSLMVKEQDLALPCKGRVRSTCNELLLILDPDNHGTLFLYNLITNVGRSVPRGKSDECGGHTKCKCGLSLTYDKFKGLYKIVHVFVGSSSVQCEMFVLKSESVFLNKTKWKKISKPSYVGERKHFWDDPVCVNGRYLYWDVCSTEYILSMDITKEKFYKVPLPVSTTNYSLLEMGGYLHLQLPICKNYAKLWSLEHFKANEWKQLEDVIIRVPGLLRYPQPIAMLKRGGYIIYKRCGISSVLFAHKLETGEWNDLKTAVAGNESCLARSTDLGVTIQGN